MLILPGRAAKGVRPSGPFSINRESPQARGLIAWWPLMDRSPRDVITGTSATNTSAAGSGFAATVEGAPLIQALVRIQGNAGTYINTNRSLGRTPITVSAWVRYTNTTETHYIIGSGGGSIDWRYTNAGQLAFTMRGVWDDSQSYTLNTDQLYHLAFSFDGTTARHYVNGVQAASSAPGSVSDASATIYLLASGTGGAGEFASSNAVSDVRYYNRALTAAEVWALYDPATRWDLYATPGRRMFFDVAAAGATGVRNGYYLTMLGVN